MTQKPQQDVVLLSTPHGALGTGVAMRRNPSYITLSTPHGALGTS